MQNLRNICKPQKYLGKKKRKNHGKMSCSKVSMYENVSVCFRFSSSFTHQIIIFLKKKKKRKMSSPFFPFHSSLHTIIIFFFLHFPAISIVSSRHHHPIWPCQLCPLRFYATPAELGILLILPPTMLRQSSQSVDVWAVVAQNRRMSRRIAADCCSLS